MDDSRDDRIRDVVRHVHDTDPEPVDFDVDAGLADVLNRVGPPLPSTHHRAPDSTRFLSAAAHLDEGFADAAMREFLIEPNRAFTPDPDVDAPAVLREVASAQQRRWIRDSLLVMLLAAAVAQVSSWPLLVAWLVLGAVAGGVSARRQRRVGLGVVAVAGLATLYLGRDHLWPVDGWFVLPLLATLMLAVVLTDEFVAQRFSRTLRPLPRTLPGRHLLPALGDVLLRIHGSRADQLAVPVTVARDRRLFVGAGEPRTPWFTVVGQAPPVTAGELYDEVAARMGTIRDLHVEERVIVDAEGLVSELASPAAAHFLTRPYLPPTAYLTSDRARELREHPLEWARSYVHFRLSTGSGMTVSALVHMRVGDGTLYVEWRPYVLRPVSAAYRVTDTASPLRPLAQGVLDFVTLPVTAPRRLLRVVRLPRPLPIRQGAIHPGQYGSAHSLRELAAGDDTRNDFQLADEERYLRLLENRFTAALTYLLRDHGVPQDEIVAAWSGRVADRQFHR